VLPNSSPEHGEICAVKPELWMWLVADAPAVIKNAFTEPIPGNGWVIKLAKTIAKDIAMEACLISLSTLPLIGRIQLDDGEVALLFGPDGPGSVPQPPFLHARTDQ
jgi:hypothetical protein